MFSLVRQSNSWQCGGVEPPRFLFVHLSETCNLRCQHCLYWKPVEHDTSSNISIGRKLELLEEFADLSPRGVVVTCGAESTMNLAEFYLFTTKCQQLDLRCLSVTNGTAVATATAAEKMIEHGPTELSVSLDSHLEDLHDELRGVRGAYKSATRAIRLLLEARKAMGRPSNRIHAMLLLCGDNYLDLEDTYDFALNFLGVDKLKINMLQPTFGCSEGPDPFFIDHSTMDADRLVAILQRCNDRFDLHFNPIWVSQVSMYARAVAAAPKERRGWSHPIFTPDHICNSYERNLVVDMKGVARLCVSEGYPGQFLRRSGDLRMFWETSDNIRERMRRCRHLCGITHSMRRVSSTIEGSDHFK